MPRPTAAPAEDLPLDGLAAEIGESPAWLRELPAVDVLRRVLVQNYTRTITKGGREV
jgi:hypothetical protein